MESHIRQRTEVSLEDRAAFDEVSVESVPGQVTLHFGSLVIKFMCRDVDALVGTMLNRLRWEHAAQVAVREAR